MELPTHAAETLLEHAGSWFALLLWQAVPRAPSEKGQVKRTPSPWSSAVITIKMYLCHTPTNPCCSCALMSTPPEQIDEQEERSCTHFTQTTSVIVQKMRLIKPCAEQTCADA